MTTSDPRDALGRGSWLASAPSCAVARRSERRTVSSRRTLRQAEILQGVHEYRALRVSGGAEGQIEYLGVSHAVAVVLTQDCDLEQDYNVRFQEGDQAPLPEDVEDHARVLTHILLCDAYLSAEIKARGYGSSERRQIKKNQLERFHSFDDPPIELEGSEEEPEAMVVDFRKAFTLPSAFVYERIQAGSISRRGSIPQIYLHDLMHRFFGYQSRVAIL